MRWSGLRPSRAVARRRRDPAALFPTLGFSSADRDTNIDGLIYLAGMFASNSVTARAASAPSKSDAYTAGSVIAVAESA